MTQIHGQTEHPSSRRRFLRLLGGTSMVVLAGAACMKAPSSASTSAGSSSTAPAPQPTQAAQAAPAATVAQTTAGGKVKLVVASANAGQERLEQGLMAEYAKRNPNIDFTFMGTDALTSGHDTNIDSIGGLLFKVQAGEQIDIVSMEISRGPGVLYDAGAAESLDQFGGKQVLDGLFSQEFVQYENKIWGFPVALAATAWIYNADLYKQAGLDPAKPPQTWDDLLAYNKALTKPPQQFGQFIILKNCWKTYPWVIGSGGDYFDRPHLPTKATVNTEPVQRAYQFIRDLVQKYKYAPDFDIKTDPLLSKQAAQYVENAGTVMILRGQDSATDYRVAPAPRPSLDAPSMAITGGSAVVMLSRSQNKQEAYKYMNWLVSEEGQRIRCGMTDVGLPRDATAQMTTLRSLANDPFWDTDPVAKGVKVGFQNTRPSVITPVYTDAYNMLADMQEKILTTNVAITDITEQVNTSIQKMLDDDRVKHPQLYA